MSTEPSYTERARKVITNSEQLASKYGHESVRPLHLFAALLKLREGIAIEIIQEIGVNVSDLADHVISTLETNSGSAASTKKSDEFKTILEQSESAAVKLGHEFVGTEHLLISLSEAPTDTVKQLLSDHNIKQDDVIDIIETILGDSGGQAPPSSSSQPSSKSKKSSSESKKQQARTRSSGDGGLDEVEDFVRDLTAEAEDGNLDPVIGRKEEIERVFQVLSRRKKNNPALVGDPGVGKTAIVEGVAQRIVNMEVPDTFYDKRVLALDMASVVAGTKYRGEFEQRMKKLIDNVEDNDSVILFIDEMHSIVGAGSAEGAIDAANIFKPPLAHGKIQCIGATTLDEYRQHIESDPALERRFQKISVSEPSEEETVQILKGLQDKYERHHDIDYTDEALDACAELANRHVNENYLPDSAIDLMDEVGSRAKLYLHAPPEEIQELNAQVQKVSSEKRDAVANQDYEKAAELRDKESKLRDKIEERKEEWLDDEDETTSINRSEVAELVNKITGIPVSRLSQDEQERLLQMEDAIHERLVNQNEAVESISKAIRRSRTGLSDPKRPSGTFMFLGPTGVGKTECARALAEFLFGDEENMIQLDMSEYMEEHTASRLVGASPGYVGYEEGGQLTEQVRRNPYSVILFDEIEKAHMKVHQHLLQIMEDGHLTDSTGREIDFSNTIIIMTSNVGAQQITQTGEAGFDTGEKGKCNYDEIKSRAKNELQKQFKPEFINRLDEVICFRQLSQDDLRKIVDLMLDEVSERLDAREVKVSVTNAAKDHLIDEGYDPEYGARPLRRKIQQLVEDPLADMILRGDLPEGGSVKVRFKSNELVFDTGE